MVRSRERERAGAPQTLQTDETEFEQGDSARKKGNFILFMNEVLDGQTKPTMAHGRHF